MNLSFKKISFLLVCFILQMIFIAPDVTFAQSSVIDSENCFVWPDVFSNQTDTIDRIEFQLRDSKHNAVTGIKVNRIDIIQNGKTIFSTEKVDSYSTKGRYKINDSVKFANPFVNANGDNLVDIVFYKFDKEVARISDYNIQVYSDIVVSDIFPGDAGMDTAKLYNELTILNADENVSVDVYLEDETGNKVSNYEGLISKSYDENLNELYIESKLEFSNLANIEEYNSYNFVVTINGNSVPIVGEYMSELYVSSEPRIYLSYHPKNDDNICYKVAGINILNNGPFELKIEQNGMITGTINNLNPTIQEDNCVMISQDITANLNSPGEPYTTYLYDKNGKLVEEEDWLEKADTKDIIIPEEEQVELPKLTAEPGLYWGSVMVSIVSETPGAVIRYTLDASEPDENSPIYTAAFKFDTTTTIKAKAYKEGLQASDVVTGIYTIEKSLTEYKEWPMKIDQPVNKVWNINFSKPVNQESVNSKSIYITDSKNNVINVNFEFGDDNKVVRVLPLGEYIHGQTYYLYITQDVQSSTNAALQEAIRMEFRIK